jgi:hypothetical protein
MTTAAFPVLLDISASSDMELETVDPKYVKVSTTLRCVLLMVMYGAVSVPWARMFVFLTGV